MGSLEFMRIDASVSPRIGVLKSGKGEIRIEMREVPRGLLELKRRVAFRIRGNPLKVDSMKHSSLSRKLVAQPEQPSQLDTYSAREYRLSELI